LSFTIDAVKMEAQCRCQALKDSIELRNAEDKKSSTLDGEDWDEVQDLPYFITSVTEGSERTNKEYFV